MQDHAVGGGNLACRNLPFARCRRDQHFARGGPGGAHRALSGGAHRIAAAGELQAHRLRQFEDAAGNGRLEQGRHLEIGKQKVAADRIGDILHVGRGLENPDLVPVGIHLVRQHLRQRGIDALPHFDMRDHGGDDIVGIDLDPGVEQLLIFPAGQQRAQPVDRIALAHGNADDQRTARHHARADKGAAGPFALFRGAAGLCLAHATVSLTAGCPAAALIACRIRLYMPQRQTLPAIAASICASVGLGFF